MKIGIIVAMDKELEQLREVVAGGSRRNSIVLQKCGIGKVNSAIGAMRMIDAHHPDLIISSGCAGGASDCLHIGSLVVGSAVAYHDVYCGPETAAGQVQGLPARYEAPSELVAKATEIGAVAGLIASGDWFVTGASEMLAVKRRQPEAIAVDMESCSIAQVCYLKNVPFLSLRIISDLPLSDNNTQQYHDFWAQMANGSFEATKSFLAQL
jgi:adenosylhomocysteine nucleosidase